jgi:GT2 family glycosyltransferase
LSENITIAAAVVVYNTKCEDSPTCKALKELDVNNIKVIIYDNSTSDYGNCDYCEKQGWQYLGGKGNNGISVAYNACIDYLKNEYPVDILCVFDDDTEIDRSYFDMLIEAEKNSKNNIFVPLIYSADKLLSPGKLSSGHRSEPFKNEEEALNYEGNDISAINSCMAIRLSVFDDYRYDENIFLDGVDHHFMIDMRERNEGVTVFSYRCDHAFSGSELPSKDAAKLRFSIYAKDYAYILKNDKLSYWKLVGKRALKLCLQYKTLEFLRLV